MAAAGALIVVAIAGCGSPSPRDQLRSAWGELKHALVHGDANGLCALLDDTARAQLLAAIAQLSPPSSSSCASAARTLFQVSRDARQQVSGAKLLSVRVDGDSATTTDSTGPPADQWVKADGSWQLANLGLGN
jgi:hypothetical protein